MPFQSIPSNIITTKPRIASLAQVSAVSGTYYTVLDASSIGELTYCNIHADSLIAATNLNIRITVDGVANTIQAPSIANIGYLASTSLNATRFDYMTDIRFNTSLKVEIMQNTGFTISIYGAVHYSLI